MKVKVTVFPKPVLPKEVGWTVQIRGNDPDGNRMRITTNAFLSLETATSFMDVEVDEIRFIEGSP